MIGFDQSHCIMTQMEWNLQNKRKKFPKHDKETPPKQQLASDSEGEQPLWRISLEEIQYHTLNFTTFSKEKNVNVALRNGLGENNSHTREEGEQVTKSPD